MSSSQAALKQRHAAFRRRFYYNVLRASLLAGAMLAVSLALGIVGYHFIAGFDWIDSLLNASMILSGMGPVGTLNSAAAKIFASFYALFSGVVFISATGVMLAPMVHRVLYHFHVENKAAS